MKNLFKTTGAIAFGMALLLGLQHIPFHDIFTAKAQTTTRMIAGPWVDPFTDYATPSSSTLNTSLPSHALFRMGMGSWSNGWHSPATIDINADGLMDFVYSVSSDSGTTNRYSHQYVVLNTGNGYNLVYICKYDVVSGVTTYKGDCAAI